MDKNEMTKKVVLFVIAIGVSVAATALSRTATNLVTENWIKPVVDEVVDQVVPKELN